MKRVVLMSKDPTLRAELEAAIPAGVKVVDNLGRGPWQPVFLDMDSLGSASIKGFSDEHLVVAVTDQKRTTPAMEATAHGAYDIVHRPLSGTAVQRLLKTMIAYRAQLMDSIALDHLPPTPTCAIVGHSRAIIDVCKQIAKLSQSEAPVLITGETGTGKELIAESIAQMSSRFGKPFVVVNCAAVPEHLLESELFGYEQGAFSGAVGSKEGMLKVADGGCVFFDEVGELPLPLQGKLLRFLQTQTFYPVGGIKEISVDVRVISATNRDLPAMVRSRKFREDLYYRLRVTAVHAPPLRQRRSDIKPLINFFIDKYKKSGMRQVMGISRALLDVLQTYDWPGNIRELENSIRSAIAMCKTPYLSTHDLKCIGEPHGAGAAGGGELPLSSVIVPGIKKMLDLGTRDIYRHVHDEVDSVLLGAVLEYTANNHSEAARLLGINRLTLRKKLAEAGSK